MKKILFLVAALMGFTFASAQSVVDNYNQSVQALQSKDYAKAAELVLESDRQIKTSFDEPDRLLELLVLQLAQEAGRG